MNRMLFDLDFVLRHLPDFVGAVELALEIFAAATVLALALSVPLALARLARGPVRWIASGYIELFRNTPLLIQLYFIFFGLPIAGIVFSPFVSGTLALGAQHAAFFAEILRGTIQSVASGQRDAGLALGLMPNAVMRKVVLPQAIRNAVPAMGGQFALLLHDTSLASTIGVMEITLQGRTLAEQSAASFEMFVAVGAIYLLLSTAFSVLIRGLEQTARYAR
jgi:amine acid ABC transporter, permease protein, 3-TM region, His/Glu/Gln/Arg/opine family